MLPDFRKAPLNAKNFLSRRSFLVRAAAFLKGWRTYQCPAINDKRSLVYSVYANSGESRPALLLALHGKYGTAYEYAFTDLPKYSKKHGFIIVCPKVVIYENGMPDYDNLRYVVRNILGKYSINNRRIYILGNSLGGFAALSMGLNYQNMFSGIASFYGVLDKRSLSRLIVSKEIEVPIFLSHDASDEVVPISICDEFAGKLEEMGVNHKYLKTFGFGHNAKHINAALPTCLDYLFNHVR